MASLRQLGTIYSYLETERLACGEQPRPAQRKPREEDGNAGRMNADDFIPARQEAVSAT